MTGRRVPVAALIALSVAALAAGGGVLAYATAALKRKELAAGDTLSHVRHRTPSGVAVVAIDAQTLADLDVRPPLRRTLHAKVIARLAAARPATIAYDVQFTERSEPPHEADDDKLALAVWRATRRVPVVLATAEVLPNGHTLVFGGDRYVRAVGARAADASVPNDPDGVVRRMLYAPDGLETLPVAAARAAGRPVPRGALDGARGRIDFPGAPGTVPTYSFSAVLAGRVPASAFRGRVVVVGATAATFHDLHPTPTSGTQLMSGPELQADAIDTALRGMPLRPAPWPLAVIFIVAAALAGGLGALTLRRARHRPWLGMLLAPVALLVLLAAVLATIVAAFAAGVILPVTYALGAFGFAGMLSGALLVSWDAHERARDKLRAVFARFVPEQAVEQITRLAAGERGLRGVELDATVMFADLRGFSGYVERYAASDVIELLDRYLGEMSDAVLAHGGTVVSYMGDGLMAVFGAPLAQDDHAERALAAAAEMAGPRLAAFNAWMAARGHDEPFALSVGLNSGPVASGTVGSERRLEYAAVGATTNLASRLEGLTRRIDVPILLSAATRARLGDGATLRAHGEFDVRGISESIAVWSYAPRGVTFPGDGTVAKEEECAGRRSSQHAPPSSR